MNDDLHNTDWNALHRMSYASAAETRFLADLYSTCMASMTDHLDRENALLRSGAVNDALALYDDKNNLATFYSRSSDLVRRNLVALTRHCPDRLDDLKDQQSALFQLLGENAELIKLLRGFSEKILRDVAKDANTKSALTTYGENGRTAKQARRPQTGVVIVSTSM